MACYVVRIPEVVCDRGVYNECLGPPGSEFFFRVGLTPIIDDDFRFYGVRFQAQWGQRTTSGALSFCPKMASR